MKTDEYPRLRSLKKINRLMTLYYLQRKLQARLRPLAYVTSGAPVKILEAMGILLTQSDIRDELRGELGLPILLVETDMCDSRLYNEGAIQERVAAFLEMLQ